MSLLGETRWLDCWLASVCERVLFIGTQFSILYTSMYSCLETRLPHGQTESVDIVLAVICWAPSAQGRRYPDRALYLPTDNQQGTESTERLQAHSLPLVNKPLSLPFSLLVIGEEFFDGSAQAVVGNESFRRNLHVCLGIRLV